MKALQAIQPGKLELVSLPVPQMKTPTEVRVRVKTAGICGSDLHIAHGTNPYATYPRVLGHEVAGVVEEAGPGVTTLKPGDPVVLEPIVYCGGCYACNHGRPNVCEHLQVRGVHLDGGFAEYLVSEEKYLHKLPPEPDFSIAALIEPFTIGMQANARGGTQPGDTVLVQGAGPIGLIAMLVAKSLGAYCIVSEINPSRREKARQLNADAVLDPSSADVVKEIMRLTDGKGVNVIHEATGVPSVLAQSLQMASTAGRIVAYSFATTPIPIDFMQVNKKELSLLGTRHQAFQFEPAIRFVASHTELARNLISHELPLEEYQKGFDLFAAKNGNACKVILRVD